MHDLCAHNELLKQFHMKTQYMIRTLSCFMNKLKFKRYCLEVNFDSFFDIKKSFICKLNMGGHCRHHKNHQLLKFN